METVRSGSSDMSEDIALKWRSPLLGEARTLDLAQGTIEYFERGRGPTLVLVHGWVVNANLWRKVVDALHEDFRCLTLDLPLGSHRVTMPQGADLGPDGIAALRSEEHTSELQSRFGISY